MNITEYSKYIFILLFGVFSILSFIIIKSYLGIILTAFILAYLFYPIYKWLFKKIKKRSISAIIVVMLILLIAVVPLTFIISSLISEIDNSITYIKTEYSNLDIYQYKCGESETIFCSFYSKFKEYYPDFDFKKIIISVGTYIINLAYGTLKILTSGILNFFIVLYIVFFLLLDGEKLVESVKKVLLLKRHHEKDITKTLQDTTYAVVYGTIITSLIQGVVGGIGYYFIGGFESVIMLTLATAFFALVPFFGTAFIWLPLGIYQITIGVITSDGSQVIRGVILLIYGFLVISTIDNIIKPKIIGDRARIHPVVVLLGVLGGLQFMNVIGIIIGPIILAVFIKILEIFELEKKRL